MKPEEIKEIQRRSFERLGKGLDHGVQYKDDAGSWVDCAKQNDGTAFTGWHGHLEYRIRPDTVNVFGVELPSMRSGYYYEIDGVWFARIQFDEEDEAKKFWEFVEDCQCGVYAQKPKKKVTADQIKAILYLRPAENAAQKIIDLFEKGE